MILKSETYNFHRLDLTRQAGFVVTVCDEDGLKLAATTHVQHLPRLLRKREKSSITKSKVQEKNKLRAALQNALDDNTDSTKTCERCGGRSERVTTLPKSSAAPGYDLYECLECNDIEWMPQVSTVEEATTIRSFPLI